MSAGCVRGCEEPYLDPDTSERLTRPRPASNGYLCRRCADTLHRYLTEIPDSFASLSTRIGGGDPLQPGKRGKLSGSPALLRLDVWALLDPHSTATGRYYEPGDENSVGDIPGVIISFAVNLADDLNLTHKPETLWAAVQLMTGEWYQNLCYRPWIDDCYDWTKTIYDTLRRCNGVTDPVSIGRCHCGTQLYRPETVEAGVITCPSCGHRMNGVAVVRLKNAQEILDNRR